MLYRPICRVLGYYLYILALVLCLPLGLALYAEFVAPQHHPQPHSTWAFAQTIGISLLLGGLFHWIGRHQSSGLYKREALFVVVAIWVLSSLIGMLPFTLSRTLTPVEAFFEMISGYSTTGASILEGKAYDPVTGEEVPIRREVTGPINTVYQYYGTVTPIQDAKTGATLYSGIEALGRALLFWRSFVCWLGGGGIVVLLIVILPALGVGGKVLYEAETSGSTGSSSTIPRIKETAGWIWKLYVFFTLLEIFLLLATNKNMPLFDAVTLSFTTLATAGYSIRNASVGAYNCAATEWVVIAFMLVGSISFILYYYCWRRKIYRLYRDPEFLIYLASLTLFASLVIWNIYGTTATTLLGEKIHLSLGESIRYGLFHLVSSHSTTGFATANFDQFPYLAQTIILVVMFIGGMTSSTAGGVKIIRFHLLFRFALEKIERLFRPNRVRALRIGEHTMNHSILTKVLVLFFLVAVTTVLGILLLVVDGIDPESAISAIGCMTNNVGFAFRAGGPTWSFAFLPVFSKLVCALWMLLGRLEYFAIFLLFLPSFWKK